MEKIVFYYHKPNTKDYAHIQIGEALGGAAFYACYEGMKKYHDSFGGAVDELMKAGYEPAGFLDSNGARRYALPPSKLESLYRDLEEFVADCTTLEYQDYKDSISVVFTLIHQHINFAKAQ